MSTDRSSFEWLSGGGEMSALIRATDWAATPLGPLESWPQSLRTTVSLCLASNFPIDILWGPDAIQIYNVGYRAVCAAAHPRATGESFRVTWASAWPVIGEPFERARRGEASYLENQRIFVERNGYLEETFFTFSLSPIRDELGGVVGLFHPVTETTTAMLSERRTRALRDVASHAGVAVSIQEGYAAVLETLAHYRRDLPFVMLYRHDPSTDRVRLLGATGVEPGSAACPEAVAPDEAPWPFRAALDAGVATRVDDVLARVGAVRCAEYPEPTARAFVVPIKTNALATPFGFAVLGLSARLPMDEAYQSFVEMLGAAIGAVIGAALAHEEEKRRADELAAIDEAKTRFFSNVSHEFRTPLTLMLGPLEDVLSDADEPLPARHRERLELVDRNARRLLKLVNTLLDFSRIQAGRVEAAYRPTDLARLTTDLASVFRAAIEGAGLAFRVEAEDLGAPVFVDPDMWEKIVLNLLSNAFKFTFAGEIEVRLERRDGHARLTVRDTGTGIPTEELPNLFQRFHRVEGARGRTHEGSGIGLALIHELVRFHGGTIGVTSRERAGTTFEVEVPFGSAHLPAASVRPSEGPSEGSVRAGFVDEASGWLHDAATPAPAPTTARPRIVVAEDNADMRSYLTSLLEPLGDVEVVEDGEAALASIRRCRPDLVVSDVMMPKLDGLGLLEGLRADPATGGVPFVLVSARAGEESRVEGLRLGADDYLVKPFSARELVARATTQLKLGAARRAAETERSRLYGFFSQSPVPIVILLGPEHRFFLANQPYERLVRQDVVGRTVAEVFAPASDPIVPLLDEVYATGRPYLGKDLEFAVPDESGAVQARFFDVSYHPFREPTGEIRGILAIVVDVTDRVSARRTIEEAVTQLTEERELRERFVLTLSHDLRTPLYGMRLGAASLRRRLKDPELLDILATTVTGNVTRANGMISDLLDANRLRAGDQMPLYPEPCHLDQVLQPISEGLKALHGDRFALRNDAGAVPGRWDVKAIRRVVENLASNAIKYGSSDTPVTLSLSKGDDWVELAVHNEGEAIPPEEHEAIFRSFYRVGSASRASSSGWGVGLTLVEGIAVAHGGSVRVQSAHVGGTTFFVRFPLEGRPLPEPRAERDPGRAHIVR